MLPFDFEFYQPETLEEAVQLYQTLDQQGKQPMFYSGGTELITLGRIDMAFTEAVIDIKGIAECNVMQVSGDHLLLGSTLSLTKIEETNLFPLLTKTASEVADHTARGKITLGGNICARIFYREAVLPFLLADSQLFITGPEGKKVVSINDMFQGKLKLKNGELLVQLVTENRFVKAPYFSMKRRQQWETGYPLITVAALKIAEEIRVAVSGLCPFPFRSTEMEETLNNRSYSVEEKVERALSMLPNPILDDMEGSADYRLFVLRHLLMDMLATLERGNR